MIGLKNSIMQTKRVTGHKTLTQSRKEIIHSACSAERISTCISYEMLLHAFHIVFAIHNYWVDEADVVVPFFLQV